MTPDEDIATALRIESEVPAELKSFYLHCMNDKPMSQRETEQELRDGCILTHHVYLKCKPD